MEKAKVDLTELTELPEYSDEEDAKPTGQNKAPKATTEQKDNYVSLHSSAFKDFVLKQELLQAINDCGYEHPSEVQHQAIPHAILGTDVLCQAKSGMGKTAVFVIAVLQQDPPPNVISTIVLCHTRELAFQVKAEFDRFLKFISNVKTAVFFGGIPIEQDIATLKENKTSIVIGTPGRTLQLIREGYLNVSKVKYFILDECDKMLSQLDMRKDVQDIFKETPRSKQVMMFSATMSPEIRVVCKKFMHSPLEIYIDDGSKLTLHGLHQFYVKLRENEKIKKLIELMDKIDFNQVIIFVRSSQNAEKLAKIMLNQGFPTVAIHGQMNQEERIEKYKKFRNFDHRILVSTNLFGRGIDIERVNVVVNFDMAENSDTYLHRVGRAGRFGTKGLSISFISNSEDEAVLEEVQKRFVVKIPLLPDEIDPSTYKTS